MSLLSPLARAAHVFFRKQLKLRLRGGPRLEFVERDGTREPTAQEREAARVQAELDAARRELAATMDQDADLRRDLRHLAYIEHTLALKGWRALQLVPLDVLGTALDQFEGLVSNWEPRGLALLRSRMAVTLAERTAAADAGHSTPATGGSVSLPSA